MLLECQNVTKRFGELRAVNNLSFQVEQREIFGIAGPNGAGKTTLFNVISGYYRAEGEVFFEGRRISGCRPHQVCLAGIARTFQIPQVFQSMTVWQNVQIGAYFGSRTKAPAERIGELLDFVGLSAKRQAAASQLCLLDKKLLMLAAALATQPRLLLLDEPASGLNPRETRRLVALIRQLNAESGLTVIIIEHSMKVLTQLSRRLMIIENGSLLCIGPPGEVAADRRVIEAYLGSHYAAG